MPGQIFDEQSWRYEALVDWPKRLANEAPFFRELFAESNVQTVLDAACGTGHHVEMFHSWGLVVEGADFSQGMIERCRARLGESDRLHWVVRSFEQPVSPACSFDAVVCVGNSLSLAPDKNTVRLAVRTMVDSLRPGGVCVIQVLNVWAMSDGPTVWQKTLRLSVDGKDHILLKGIHRAGDGAWVEVVDLELGPNGLTKWSESTSLVGISPDDICLPAKSAGAVRIEAFGNYRREPYDRQASQDLIVVCRK